jgi:glycosyltransferase involved in cell wall biosynthesis
VDYFIFIPAYNVEKELSPLLSRIPRTVWENARICVINDGSQDNTLLEAEVFEAPGLNYQIHTFSKNKGYGAVVKKGLQMGLESKAKYICCLHGDGQYPPESIPYFFEEMQKYSIDVLQGSRHLEKGSAKKGGMPLYKIIGGFFLTQIENLFFNTKLTDRHSGFLCYSHEFLKNLDLDQLSSSFDIDLEILAIADSRRFKIEERAIKTRYAGEYSNLNVWAYGLRVLHKLFKKHQKHYH